MEAVLDAVKDRPEWALAVAAIAALVWVSKQWAKSIDNNIQLANKFGGAIEAGNLRAETMQRSLDRLEARG
jgi:hypothetical protein